MIYGPNVEHIEWILKVYSCHKYIDLSSSTFGFAWQIVKQFRDSLLVGIVYFLILFFRSASLFVFLHIYYLNGWRGEKFLSRWNKCLIFCCWIYWKHMDMDSLSVSVSVMFHFSFSYRAENYNNRNKVWKTFFVGWNFVRLIENCFRLVFCYSSLFGDCRCRGSFFTIITIFKNRIDIFSLVFWAL